MPPFAGFEEKEYEVPLLMELTRGRPGRLWSPGQVLEATLGFDAALVAACHYWRIVGRKPTVGMDVLMAVGPAFRHAHHLPLGHEVSFRTNLFLQIKRPYVYQRRPRGLQQHHGQLGATWYSIEIPATQGALLAALQARVFSGGGANPAAEVALIAPVFSTRQDLWRLAARGQLVDHSNSPSILRIQGHRRWAYQSSGGAGYALSSPQSLDMGSLLARVNNLSRNRRKKSSKILAQNIAFLHSHLDLVEKRDSGSEQLELFDRPHEKVAMRVGQIAAHLRDCGFTWLVVD